MQLSECLQREHCLMRLTATTKEAAIAELTGTLAASGLVKDQPELIRRILDREKLGSTGIGNQVAIPHAPTPAVSGLVIAFGRSEQGIDFNALDGQEVRQIFLIGSNPRDLNVYLHLLARLSKLLNDKFFRHEFTRARTADELLAVIKKHEKSALAVTK
ncbi:MAG TPA: PTS sugar transporter subunit IIA [Candidatus Omnitrophota bacterium]|nr:PTS sugar transporter subunit IIA [Candidatus Omnitrophota bacterium]HRZ14569.1 PTS sugar transporter subunit IIA [Candidatus Omnitrophota bacterium]